MLQSITEDEYDITFFSLKSLQTTKQPYKNNHDPVIKAVAGCVHGVMEM